MGKICMRLVDGDKATVEWLAVLIHEYFLECDEGKDGSLEFEEGDPLLWICHLPPSFPWKMHNAEFMHKIMHEYELLAHWNYER